MILAAALAGCRQPAAWQYVPDDAAAILIVEPEALLMANLSLDQNPAVPPNMRPQSILAGPSAYPGTVYGFQLIGRPGIWFFLGRAESPKAAGQLLEGVAGMIGSDKHATQSVAVPGSNFTLTALYQDAFRAEATCILDSLAKARPGQGRVFRDMPGTPGGMALLVPDLAQWLENKEDSAFTRGRLWVQSSVRTSQVQCRFSFTPANGNPLKSHPMLDTYSRLHPWPGSESDTGITELALRIRKGTLMPRLRQDRRYRGLELMVGLFNIPAEQLMASAGSDIYFRGNAAAHSYSVTMSVGHPGRMEALLKGMIRDGSLSGPENHHLLGNKHTELYTHGGLISLRHREGAVPEAFGGREDVSLSLRANSAFLLGLQDLVAPEKGIGPRSPLRQVRNLKLELLNHDDGSFTGTVEVEHRLDLTHMVEKI